ncbi:MAG: neutral/alkaline non-lysosomal ceramidase N-terminal domain-containing protein [Bacteroidota bacterium]
MKKNEKKGGRLVAGAAVANITPKDSQFLYGYPHVERYSTGIHDKLWASSLYLSDGKTEVIFIANDIIWVSKDVVANARKAISDKTGIKPENIMITATHTHSGPHTVDYVSNQADPAVPKADQNYVDLMKDGIIQAGIEAYQNAQPAKLGLEIADDTGVGTNRRDPNGPADHNVPVLLVKNAETDANIACMLVCSMHPTVMHEDSTLVSGDFPSMARKYLQENVLGNQCPVVYHMGPSGNQSPRHVTKSNTFEEAERLGVVLGKAVEKVIGQIDFKNDLELSIKVGLIEELPKKVFPDVKDAEENLKKAVEKLENLRNSNAPKQETRTAECDWFGAEETLTLSKAAANGLLEGGHSSSLPAEIQVIKIGQWNFVGWQGEVFIEYPLAVKQKAENTFVISCANGEMQGYLVTKEAAEEGGYEASNSLFSYEAGEIFVNKTIEILDELK